MDKDTIQRKIEESLDRLAEGMPRVNNEKTRQAFTQAVTDFLVATMPKVKVWGGENGELFVSIGNGGIDIPEKSPLQIPARKFLEK